MAEDQAVEAASADDVENAEGQPGKKSKKKLMVMIIAGVLLIGGAGAGVFLFMSGGDQEMAAKAPAEGEEATEESEAGGEGEETAEGKAEGDADKEGVETSDKPAGEVGVTFGETYKMKTFHLNLGNPLENHYIRVDVALEYRGGEEQKAEIEKRLPQLRDAIVGVISRQTRDMILDPDGKAQLRREMLIRINRYMKTAIEAVYITDILIE